MPGASKSAATVSESIMRQMRDTRSTLQGRSRDSGTAGTSRDGRVPVVVYNKGAVVLQMPATRWRRAFFGGLQQFY
jgi:hypothetical protein